MAQCQSCHNELKKDDLIAKCSKCKKEYHADCVTTGRLTISNLKNFVCLSCAQVTVCNIPTNNLNSVINDIPIVNTSNVNKFDEILQKILDINKRLDTIETNTSKITALVTLNHQLQRRIDVLEQRVENFEQQKVRKCIQIFGVPEDLHGGNVEDIVTTVINKGLQIDLDKTEIVNCHRLKAKQGSSTGNSNTVANIPKSNGIFLKLKTVSKKNEILKKRRELKKNFTLLNIGLNDTSPIYINECLTVYKNKLFKAAKEKAKEKKFKYVWMRDGNVMIRKAEKDKIIYINLSKDLDKL